MKMIEYSLVRLLQLLVLVFFTFVVLLWFGVALLLPLTLWFNLTSFFGIVFWPLIAMLLALAVVGAIGFYMSKIPKLVETLFGLGVDLAKLGYNCIKRLGEIAASVHNGTVTPAPKTDAPLNDSP